MSSLIKELQNILKLNIETPVALVGTAWKVKNGSKHFRKFYYLILARKNKGVAKVATARKLAVAIYYMWKRREPFKEPHVNG